MEQNQNNSNPLTQQESSARQQPSKEQAFRKMAILAKAVKESEETSNPQEQMSEEDRQIWEALNHGKVVARIPRK
ncbi:MAG: hypothetical protein IJ622_01800 [Bacteroidales bacterium]|nr:hypothetical protein [Bacteroidales bacterium]